MLKFRSLGFQGRKSDRSAEQTQNSCLLYLNTDVREKLRTESRTGFSLFGFDFR